MSDFLIFPPFKSYLVPRSMHIYKIKKTSKKVDSESPDAYTCVFGVE